MRPKAFGFILLVILLLAPFTGCKREAPPPATQPTSQPATAPATKPVEIGYVDVVRASYPKFPATQPLGLPVDLNDAGHWLLPEPIYLCPRGDLWITHHEAPPTAEVLAKSADVQIHLIRERVRFVQWALDDQDKPLTRIVIENANGQQAWVEGEKITPLKMTGYRWERAVPLGPTMVVPTARGVSVFTFSPEFTENYQEVTASEAAATPMILRDPRGMLAWSPWDGDKPGDAGAWRFVDGKWVDLKSNKDWSHNFVHLIPLLDGSVLQIIRKDGGKVGLALASVDAPNIDEKIVNQLIEQLSDDDPDKRDAAYAELTRYGPASWPILEKQLEDQPPEARIRMQQLLRSRITPMLGGRMLVDGVAKVAARVSDGGLVLYAPAGVSIPREDKAPEIIKPAWLSIRPGRAIELLEPVLVKDANPDKQRLFAFDNEWIIADTTQGPRRLLGNHVEPMLRKDESAYVHVVGYDQRGRWLFKKSPTDAATLVLDPTLPDPSPRLPVWLLFVDKGQTGWTAEGWPVMKRGGEWAITATGYRALDPKKEKMITARPRVLGGPFSAVAQLVPATTRSTTTPATATATTAQASLGPPLLTDRDGRKYHDGKQFIRVIDRTGRLIEWQLPANAASNSDFEPVLLQTEDGVLFLFNEPGRVVRIKPVPAPDAAEPFAVEAVFTQQIPASDDIRRIWLDPAGRIVIAYEPNRLAILFPGGRIPREIATLMLETGEQRRP